jgi:D-glycero-D-manno-heptose 1,7-bisphosphate phosphatase
MTGAPGVLLDRDGTLIRDVGYLRRTEEIEVLPEVREALRVLRRSGLKVAVVTNQSAVARGLLTEAELQEIHRRLEEELALGGAFLDGIYYCPHHPSEGRDPYRISCPCRKPRPGLAHRAAAELRLDLSLSYVVGDQSSDMELAAAIGAQGLRIDPRKTGVPENSGAVKVSDLREAADWISEDVKKKMEGKTALSDAPDDDSFIR